MELSLEVSSSYQHRIFQKERFTGLVLFSITGFFRYMVYGSRWFGLSTPESGGSFNAIFAGFRLREEMILSHRLRRLFTGVIPVPFDRRFLSFDLPLTLDLILCRFLFPEIRSFHLQTNLNL
ncbi:hypothetical protein DY000_02057108 [Brassica cretica]|uniref:Uncharacterized protein n=1 Tax=Brassica cretica TaxID=69181 RepID=A0ABQ7A6T7_BRACR|nr:hypothetical protein DY000_02057108 [Brassica cretica]